MTKSRYMEGSEIRIQGSGSDRKARELSGGLVVRDVDALDVAAHFALQGVHQSVHVFLFALHDQLHPAVREVADVALNGRVVAGEVLGRVAKAHALHAPAEVIGPPLHAAPRSPGWYWPGRHGSKLRRGRALITLGREALG